MAHPFPIPFGRYHLVERLAVGGMAELFLATSPGEHGFAKTIVIKRLLPHLAREAAYNAMFIDEAKLTARLVHPKIAQTYELGRVADTLFIAMEYVDGIDVLAMLRELAYRRQRVPVEIAVWIAHEVLDALDFAHNLYDEMGHPLGVVHRDISPSNVLLSRRGDVKLVDFGIARAAASNRAHQTKSGTLKGKYGYMSPEQVVEMPVDARSDLFSVGIVLAEMLCGRRLFAAANELDVLLMVRDAKLSRLDKFGTDIEHRLDGILRKALRKNVEERWQSAAEFRDALDEWMFEQRLRVAPKNVAEVVESLQEAAQERRRSTLSAAADAASAVLDQADVEARAMGSVRQPASGSTPPVSPAQTPDGPVLPPGGRLTPQAVELPPAAALPPVPHLREDRDSMPVISVEMPEPADVHSEPTSPGQPAPSELRGLVPRGAPPKAFGPPDPASGTPLDDLRLELEAELPRKTAALGKLRSPVSTPASAAASAAVSAAAAPARPDDPPEEKRPTSERYPSIEAAISALAPIGPDPAAEDFDGTDVGSKQREAVLPRAEQLAVSPPVPPVVGEINAPADDTGDFAVTAPLTVLFRLMTSRATGLLVCSIGGIKKEIYVRDGLPEYVSSNVASELFGSYLVGQGVLSEGELAMALAMMPHYGSKLGDTLVGLGLLRPLEVFRHLTRQVRAKLVDVCTWSKGSFGWYAGRENPREAFPLDLNGFEVLGAGAMSLPDDTVDAWALRNRGSRLRAVKGGRIGPQRFELAGLREMHERLDGRKSLGELLELHTDPVERRRTARMLMLLAQTELARP